MKWVISIVTMLIGLLYFASLLSLPTDRNSNHTKTNIVVTSLYGTSHATKYIVHTTLIFVATVFIAAGYILAITIHSCNQLDPLFKNHLRSVDSPTKEAYGIHALGVGEVHEREEEVSQ
jgi:hypothetical protein